VRLQKPKKKRKKKEMKKMKVMINNYYILNYLEPAPAKKK